MGQETITRFCTLLLLLAGLVANVLVLRPSSGEDSKTRNKSANIWAAVVCFVAAFAYIELQGHFCGIPMNDVRHADWLITCPLLLLEMGALLNVSAQNKRIQCAIAASALMVLVGWAEAPSPLQLLCGFALLGVITWQLIALAKNQKDKSKQRIVIVFFSLWFLYGFVAMAVTWASLNSDVSGTMYNILDGASKGIFGLCVAYMALAA